MARMFRRTVDLLIINKYSLMGLGVSFYFARRVSRNMYDLEENSKEKKLFDPVKARAQIEVYKEIYNIGEDDRTSSDKSLKILQSASDNDIEKINQFFEKHMDDTTGERKSEIEKEMERLKTEIDSLEEVKSEHQGFKFYRTVMTKDTFEDALIELREKEFEKKFRKEKEDMIGREPKVI
mmetsp:Transcript_42545/g.40799  ORF Transcript_42545/g.40799 Transcript_42545/m.40799 type:complete len:180 (-) Transcript_42545:27-566(-)